MRAGKRRLIPGLLPVTKLFPVLGRNLPPMLANPVVMNVVSQFTVHDSVLGEKAITSKLLVVAVCLCVRACSKCEEELGGEDRRQAILLDGGSWSSSAFFSLLF